MQDSCGNFDVKNPTDKLTIVYKAIQGARQTKQEMEMELLLHDYHTTHLRSTEKNSKLSEKPRRPPMRRTSPQWTRAPQSWTVCYYQ